MEYLNLLFFILFSFLLAGLIFLVSYIGVLRQYDIEKVSSYECGFDPFDEDSRGSLM